MADQEQVERLLAGVEGWNAWRAENPGFKIDLRNAGLQSASLGSVDLRNANLQSADLRNAYLRDANLGSANLGSADLRSADLRGANLQSADLWGVNFRSTNLQNADLQNADLRGAHCPGADLRSANLQRAYLRSADLRGAHCLGADLRGANLWEANLWSANLRNANLWSANLTRANLQISNLQSTKLQWATVEEMQLGSSVLGDVDLQETAGLDTVRHKGPSTLDNRTLVRSQGQIPDVFLQGCGFQDWEIEAAKLHNPDLSRDQVTDIGYRVIDLKSRSPIQINPVFISYSHADSAFVEAVEPLLNNKGIRYWRDVHDMTAGPLEDQIERAIRVNPTYLLVLSQHSIRSDWVEWEAQKARELEKELLRQGDHRHVLCPVALDDTWKDAAWAGHLKHQIQKYNILDFSQWRDVSAMRGMFGRLLDGLGIYYRSDSA